MIPRESLPQFIVIAALNDQINIFIFFCCKKLHGFTNSQFILWELKYYPHIELRITESIIIIMVLLIR
jgi:hypothetical protein